METKCRETLVEAVEKGKITAGTITEYKCPQCGGRKVYYSLDGAYFFCDSCNWEGWIEGAEVRKKSRSLDQ